MPFLVDSEPRPGADLMRRDAERFATQEADPARPAAMLLYRWDRPTLSFGYAQDPEREFDMAAVRRARMPWVRRPTGGRAILHANEWTYSVVGAIGDVRFGGTARAAFDAVTAVVRQALCELGIPVDPPGAARTAFRSSPVTRTACFASTWGHEITCHGRKLAGSAQRRGRRAFLQQGTILVGPGHAGLAEWTRLGGADRRALAESIRSATLTVAHFLGSGAEFSRFATCLHRAWSESIRPDPRSLDREVAET